MGVRRRIKKKIKATLIHSLGLKATLEKEREKERREWEQQLNECIRERKHLANVVRALITRHYGDLQLPPEALRLNVGTRTNGANFWAQGISSSTRVLKIFGEEPKGAILDWGCGSGRTRLWLNHLPAWREHWHGCDVDAAAIEWLREQGIHNVKTCDDLPPLPYDDGAFCGAYAFSVLTHIHPERHELWYAELARVLKPGALLYVTTLGPSKLGELQPEEQVEFLPSEWVYVKRAGHYKNGAIIKEAYTRQIVPGCFTIETYAPRGYQDMDSWLIRRLG